MRIGFFGGAFDPLHSEHIEIINNAAEELGLDKLVLVPTYSPPHKSSTVTPYELRRKMLEKYTSKTVEICDYEHNSRKPYNCTAQTLPKLKELYPANEYYFIIGSDSMLAFSTWIRPDLIAKEVTLAVVVRSSYEKGLDEAVTQAKRDYGADITILSIKGAAVSSREIRAKIELFGVESVAELDDNTKKIIIDNNLYVWHGDMVGRVKGYQPHRYPHMAYTVLQALKLDGRTDYDKVFIAALLHDLGKHVSVPGVPEDSIGTPVEHQFASAILAERDFGITDSEVLDAIRYHTTGRPNMSKLEKLIYLADVIEPLRDYDGVDYLRQISYDDIDKGFLLALKSSYDTLTKQGRPIYQLTLDAVKYYLN